MLLGKVCIQLFSLQLSSLTFTWQPVEEKENSEFEPALLCLETGLQSHQACGKGVGNRYKDSFDIK